MAVSVEKELTSNSSSCELFSLIYSFDLRRCRLKMVHSIENSQMTFHILLNWFHYQADAIAIVVRTCCCCCNRRRWQNVYTRCGPSLIVNTHVFAFNVTTRGVHKQWSHRSFPSPSPVCKYRFSFKLWCHSVEVYLCIVSMFRKFEINTQYSGNSFANGEMATAMIHCQFCIVFVRIDCELNARMTDERTDEHVWNGQNEEMHDKHTIRCRHKWPLPKIVLLKQTKRLGEWK